jgi:hypothetical protein
MSYGAGHVLDMINRMKQNRAMRPSKRSKFKENNREGIHATTPIYERPNFRTVSKEQLDSVKKQIQARAAVDRIKERIIYIICITVVIGMFIYFWGWLI